jgi:uncharacterized damage-inducible protein DinB
MTDTHPRLGQLLGYMDETRTQLMHTVENINPSFASIRPREGAWSAAENLAHLAKVEAGVAGLLEKSVAWARSNDVGSPQSQDSVFTEPGRVQIPDKLEAPEMVRPEEDMPIEISVDSLRRSRERIREALLSSADLDLSSVKRPHRVLGELDMYKWVEFVAQHEERHRKQIDRTMGEVTERAAECAPIV